MPKPPRLFSPTLTGPTDSEVLSAQAIIDARKEAIDIQRRESLIRCDGNVHGRGCGELSRLGDITYIQTHWYVGPSGCSEGDYWRQGAGQFDCPKCGHRNRLYEHPEIEKMRGSFKAVENEHKD